jgi:hypothetical protein
MDTGRGHAANFPAVLILLAAENATFTLQHTRDEGRCDEGGSGQSTKETSEEGTFGETQKEEISNLSGTLRRQESSGVGFLLFGIFFA